MRTKLPLAILTVPAPRVKGGRGCMPPCNRPRALASPAKETLPPKNGLPRSLQPPLVQAPVALGGGLAGRQAAGPGTQATWYPKGLGSFTPPQISGLPEPRCPQASWPPPRLGGRPQTSLRPPPPGARIGLPDPAPPPTSTPQLPEPSSQ